MANLLSKVSLPYNVIRGSFGERQNKSIQLVDKLYREITPQFKRKELSFEDLQKTVDHIFQKRLNINIRKCDDLEFDGGSDILYSPITGKITGTTLEISTPKNKLHIKDLITILHEFQHVCDQIFHPKYLIRNQYLSNNNMFTNRYDNLYDNFIYRREYPQNKKEKSKIIRTLRYKIHKFLKNMSAEDKINYLQDTRYTLLMENQAYKTQRKYAKAMNKKHKEINDFDLFNENKLHMLEEKIKLVTEMAFEIIKKERQKHAINLKKCKKISPKVNKESSQAFMRANHLN